MSVVCINTNLSSFRKLAQEMNVSTLTLHDALSIWWNIKEQTKEPTQEDLWAIISPKEIVVPNQAIMEQCKVGNIANLINLIKNVVKDSKGVTIEKLQEELGIPITVEELQQAIPTLLTWKDGNNVVHINVGDPVLSYENELQSILDSAPRNNTIYHHRSNIQAAINIIERTKELLVKTDTVEEANRIVFTTNQRLGELISPDIQIARGYSGLRKKKTKKLQLLESIVELEQPASSDELNQLFNLLRRKFNRNFIIKKTSLQEIHKRRGDNVSCFIELINDDYVVWVAENQYPSYTMLAEEMLHPLMYEIQKRNPQLFKQFLEECLNTTNKTIKVLVDSIIRAYEKEDKEVLDNEIVTQVLAYQLKNINQEQSSTFKKVISNIVRWLNEKGIFNGTRKNFNLRTFAYCLKFENVKFDLALQLEEQGFNHITTWARTAENNYEVSSQGDKRFSALYATFKEGTIIFGHDVGGRTIESVYQHGVKQGDWVTNNNSKTGAPKSKEIIKGNTEDASYAEGYLPLWQEWAKQNPELIEELKKATVGKTLTDKFASTRVSQARALADILNEKTSNTADLVIVSAKDTSKKAKEIGGIDTLRHPDENGMHFGNPFSHTNYAGVQKVMPTVKEAVLAFEKWLREEEYQDVEPERRQWIINQINSGVLIGKPLVYYTENIPDNSWGVSTYNYHNAPNHAHILQKLINEKSLNLKSDKKQIFEDEKPEITEPNIPKTNIQGEEVNQQITIAPVGKFIPEYGNIYRVNVENLINELTLLDELKLDSTINLKDLILLPDITEKNIPLIAKLCASPYFNKSKQGVETIELTDEALQKAAKRHSKVLKYNKDKETDKVTITVPKSFIVGYTLEEIDMYYNHEALMNISSISPIKLKSFAKATMFLASDYVTRILEQDPDVIDELNLTEEELKKCTSRIDVLNTIDLGRILNHIKEQFFDNHAGDLIDACQEISNNWNAFVELGFLELMQLEKIALNQQEVFQESNIALDIFDTADEQEIQEIFGSSVETWLVGFRLMSVFSGLSQMIKQRLHSLILSKLDEDGDLVPVLNELGMFEAVDATMATASILKWTRYSTSLDLMIEKLKQHLNEALWLKPLILDLEETDDEQFKASFFTNFCKYFQSYVINFVDKDGVAKSKAINENEYADTVIQNLTIAFEQNRSNLFITSKPEGIYTAGIDKLYNAINATTLQTLDIDKVINWLQIGFNIPFTGENETLLTLLKEGHNWDNFKTHMLSILKNAQSAKKPQEYNPLNSSNLSDYKGILSILEQVIPTNIESVSYSDGKLHYSYVIPSYLNILCGKISGHLQGLYTDAKNENERYLMFLQDEFGQYSWFKNRKTGKWLNHWLQRLATDSKARETFKHIAVLTKDKISYVDKNSAQYAASLIFQYFANGINSNKAYFRLPMMSNKPSEEYIQFFKTQVEEIPSILANTVFLQELERILGCKERANTILNPNSPNYHPECGIKAFDKNGLTFQFLEYLSVFLDSKQYKQTYDTLSEDIKPIYDSLKTSLDRYFSGKQLTDDETLQMIKDVEKVIKYNMDIKLNNYMQSLVQNGLLVVDNGKYRITDPALQIMDIFQTSDQIEKYLKEYFYNDVFATMLILQLTVTDKAFYKDDDDLQKRLALLHAPVMRGYVQVKDFSTGESVSDGTYRSIILKDDVIKSDILTNLHLARKLILSQISDPVIKQKTEMFLKDAISAFEEVNFADAQSFQTPTALRKKLHMFGKWTQEMEDAYNKIMSGAPYGEADVNVLWLPLKPFVYGMKLQNSYSSMGTIRSGVQFKNSEYTLILADAILRMANMPNKLQAIYDVLEATHHTKNADNTINMQERTTNGIDSCQFESTFKAGLTGIIDITEKGIAKYITKNSDKIEDIKKQLLELNPWLANNEMLLDSYLKTEVVKHILQDAMYNASDKTLSGYNKDYVQELPFDCYGLQQEVPSHFRHEQQMGSQMRALIIADTPNLNPITGGKNYVVVDGKHISVEEAKAKYMSAIVNNINISRQEIEEELNLTSKNQQLKDLALSRLLRKTILEDGRYGADALWGVTINPETGTFNRPLSDPTQLDMIEKMLNSIVKNRIHKQKIAGGPCVQVTNFGTSDELHIRYKTADTFNADGSIVEAGKLLFTEQEFNALKGLKRINRENAEKVISQRVARHLDDYVWDDKIQTYTQYVETFLHSPAYYECYAPIYADWLRDKQFLDKNGNINVDKVAEANPKALQMIGYRIPTEAKYSMCPIKIVGFLPVTAGEGIMLPKELTTLSGSDYDVDKMYIMRYDFDVRHENGKIVLKNPSSLKAQNDNYLIDTAFGFLTNPLTEQEQFTPGGFEDVKRYAYLIAAYQNSNKSWNELQSMKTEDLKKLAKTNENLIYPQTQVAYHKQNMVAAKLIGVFAVANVSHAFMALGEGKAEINCKFYDKVVAINNHQFGYVGVNKKGKPEVMGSFNIDAIYGYSGERISRILALFLAASVDAVKDPVLNLLNINLKSVNLAVTLARMGFDIQTISLFMNQPSIKRVIDTAILNDSDLSLEIEKELNRLQNITSPNDFKIAQSLEGMIFDNEDWLTSLKNEDDLTAVKNLTLAAQLLNYSRVFSAITGVTKQNSISSAVGPTNLDNIDARDSAEKLARYLGKERISQETYDLAWNAISSALYYTQHGLVDSLMNGLTFITATNNFIANYIHLVNTISSDKLTDKLKLKFITAYTGSAITPNWNQIEFITQNEEYVNNPLKAMIINYPAEFVNKKGVEYLKEHLENQVIKMLMEMSNVEKLDIKLPLDNPTLMDELQVHFAEIMKNDSLLAKELILYTYARGGWGFNVKFPLSKLFTTEVLKEVNGYFDLLRNVSEIKVFDDFMMLFKLNNHIVDDTIYLNTGVKAIIGSDIDNHGMPLWYLNTGADVMPLQEDMIYKIVTDVESYLICIKNDDNINYESSTGTIKDITYDVIGTVQEIFFLGDGNDVFEYGEYVDPTKPIKQSTLVENTETKQGNTSKPITTAENSFSANPMFDNAIIALQSLFSEDVNEILNSAQTLNSLSAEQIESMLSVISNPNEKLPTLSLAILILNTFAENKIPLSRQILKEFQTKKDLLNLC